jgi:hypothetical protein
MLSVQEHRSALKILGNKTRSNAAMVKESTAATRLLASGAAKLFRKVATFKVVRPVQSLAARRIPAEIQVAPPSTP